MIGLKGEGRFSQMPILLHKTYEVKWSTKWRGSEMKKKKKNQFMDGPLRELLKISELLYIMYVISNIHFIEAIIRDTSKMHNTRSIVLYSVYSLQSYIFPPFLLFNPYYTTSNHGWLIFCCVYYNVLPLQTQCGLITYDDNFFTKYSKSKKRPIPFFV